MQKIIVDTNFLMSIAQLGVDIFSELERICDFNYKVCIMNGTVKELNNIIKNQKGKNKAAAKLALGIIKQKDLNILPQEPNKTVDDALLGIAEEGNFFVATQDKALSAGLKQKGIKTIRIRQKKYMEFV